MIVVARKHFTDDNSIDLKTRYAARFPLSAYIARFEQSDSIFSFQYSTSFRDMISIFPSQDLP